MDRRGQTWQCHGFIAWFGVITGCCGTCQINSDPWSPYCGSDLALPHQGLGTGPLGLSCGFWHQGIDGRSFESCGLQGGATLDWIYSGISHWYLIGLGSGEFGGQVDTLSSVSCSWGHSSTVLLCPRANCPAGGTTAIRECCCHEGVFLVSHRVWVVGSCQVASMLMPGPIVCQQNITL